jgi:hypothetical protein
VKYVVGHSGSNDHITITIDRNISDSSRQPKDDAAGDHQCIGVGVRIEVRATTMYYRYCWG